MELAKDSIVYVCTKRGCYATGYYGIGKIFVVLKGSSISPDCAPSFAVASKYYHEQREKLIEDGVIVDWVFAQDYAFSSATAAACVVAGQTISYAAWKEVDTDAEPAFT